MAPRTSKEGPAIGDVTEVTVPPAPTGEITAQTAAVSVPDTQLKPGVTLGDYRVLGMIGQGGMGVVYAAVHPLIGKRAAIKILKKELCTDAGTLERFIDEARVVNEIGHPNIVDVFAFGEMPDGRSFFVMELLAGETLRARLVRKSITLADIVDIVRPLSRALIAAHGKGVVHRDLKPDNIFLAAGDDDDKPTVKLLDFGVAKLARSDHRLEKTATGAMVGTPQYVAPEQAKGYATDQRADIYALGGILFEMITGRPPFIADNAMEVVAKHLMEPPVRPSTIVSGVPDDLDTIVVRMLAKDPAERPTLTDLVAVLDRLRSAPATEFLPLSARASYPAIAHTLPPPTRRRISPLPFAIAGALVAAAAMFFIVRSLTRDETPPAAPAAAPPAELGPATAPAPAAVVAPVVPADAATPELTTPTAAPTPKPADPESKPTKKPATKITPAKREPIKREPPKREPPKPLDPDKQLLEPGQLGGSK